MPKPPLIHDSLKPLDSARRHFLRRSIAIVPAVALTGTQTTRPSFATPTHQTPSAPGGIASQSIYSPVFFHPQEWTFIQAAVARLIPSDDLGPGAIEAGVPEFIDRQMDAVFGYAAIWYMQGPFTAAAPEFGYQAALPPRDVYRAGIVAMDSYCKSTFNGKTFAELDAANQDATLKLAEAGTLAFEGTSSKTFFTFLLQNTKEGYLSDPIHGGNKNAGSWAMIGFPGARADFADWVGRPGEKYPLGPVSINGPQG
jgi:gluconate 2-dehydrogenase gamma chain